MVIRSLLFQIALRTSSCLQALEQLYKTCENGHQQPAEDKIRSLLQDAVARTGRTYIILDALDECTDREPLLAFFDKLVKANQQGVHVLVTSRREKDIEDQFNAIANHNVNIENAVVDKDIYVYVRDRLATGPKLRKWPLAVQDEISTVLMEKADGM